MEIGSGAIGVCSKEQQKMFQEWFTLADSGYLSTHNRFSFSLIYHQDVHRFVFSFRVDGDGRVTGNDAIQFFSMSHLSRAELKQVSLFHSFLIFSPSNSVN